jgi:hypothetical protein
MGFQSTHRAMSDEEFKKVYLNVSEKRWQEMPITHLIHFSQEAERRGLGQDLRETLGELTLPHERWAKQRLEKARPALQSLRSVGVAMGLIDSEEDVEDRKMLTRLANDPRFPGLTPDMVDTVMALRPDQRATFISGHRESQNTETGQPLPEASTGSGGTLSAEEIVPGVGPDLPTAQPSSETKPGAATTAESGFDVVAYRRLPLVAKRDAFISEGFLYVRTAVLKSWVQQLTAGKCCPPQRTGNAHHSSDCWLRDAVR